MDVDKQTLKRGLSLDALDITENDEPFTQVIRPSKKGKLGAMGKGKKGKLGAKGSGNGKAVKSQPTSVIDSETELEDVAGSPYCIVCNESSSPSSTIKCETCEQHYHLICCGVGESDHVVVKKFIDVLGWSCKICRVDFYEEINKLRKDITKLEGKICNEVKHGKSEMIKIIGQTFQQQPSATSSDHLSPTTDLPSVPLDYSSVVKLVQKSVKDVNFRQKNVIVSGLMEVEGANDADLFVGLCESEFGFKPMVTKDGTKRLGKDSGAGPRKLLVKLNSESAAVDLLYQAKCLRNSNDPLIANKVFINRDLSKEEAKLAFDRRQARRQSISPSTLFHSEVNSASRNNHMETGVRASGLTFINSSRRSSTISSKSSSGGVSLGVDNGGIAGPAVANAILANTCMRSSPTSSVNALSSPLPSALLNPSAAVFSITTGGCSQPLVFPGSSAVQSSHM